MDNDSLFKKINKFAEDTNKLKLTDTQLYSIFNAYKKAIQEGRVKNIEYVKTSQAVFAGQSSFGGAYLSPVCIIDVAKAQLDSDLKPALIIRFGNFEEQPYRTTEEQKSYSKSLLAGVYNDKTFSFKETDQIVSDGENKVTQNRVYNQYIALFYDV